MSDNNQPQEQPVASATAPQNEAEVIRASWEKLKAENDKMVEEMARSERLRAQMLIQGKAELTPPPKIETEHEKWAREAKIRYKGTGMDPT